MKIPMLCGFFPARIGDVRTFLCRNQSTVRNDTSCSGLEMFDMPEIANSQG